MIDTTTFQRARIRFFALRFAVAALGATIVLAAVVFFFRGQIALAIHWYIVTLGVLLLVVLDRFIARAQPLRHRSALDFAWQARPDELERPERLEDLERQVSLGQASASDFHYRLLPLLRDLAAHLLAIHRSIDTESDPVLARATLGEDVWETLWPPYEERWDRHGAGGDIGKLKRVVEVLETLEGNNND